jgi:regulator of sirC expression with transglutaminase-like and TPR domain
MRRTPSIEALIKLIEDPDLAVYEHVRAEILKNGKDAIPKLYDLLDYEHLNPNHLFRIESLVKDLHFSEILDALAQWCISSEKDLMKGLQIISSFQFPDLTLSQLENQIHAVERRIWLEVNRRMTAFEIVQRMNIMWFENIGLQVVPKQTGTPFHTFINTVIEDLCGTPLSTGLIYSIIAQRLNLPIYGVNFPDKFVMAYMDEYRIHHLIDPLGTGGVLFYLTPEEHGKVLIKKQLDEELKAKSLSPIREYFEPCSHSSLLILYLDELIEVYQKMERNDIELRYQTMKNKILELA